MAEFTPRTVRELPSDYQEVAYLHLTSSKNVLWLNILAFVPLVTGGVLFFGWLILYYGLLDAPFASDQPQQVDFFVGLGLLVLMIVLHELLHGLAIQWYGHKARYGMKLHKGVVYATADGSLFWRNQYVGVCLAPLIGISILVLLGSLFVSETLAFWLMLIGSLNAAGAIGDLWMVLLALRYPPNALIRDEEDGMRIFTSQLA